jgi:isopentenyl phosphate kinase
MVEVFDLRLAVTHALMEAGLAPVIFLPSNVMSMANGEINQNFVSSLRRFLEIGMTPLLGGDMCGDDAKGFSVCSGDKVVYVLAKLLKPKHVIFATDVAGIFTADPKLDPNAKLIPQIALSRIQEFEKLADKATNPDITKGMRGKLEEIKQFEPILRAGAQVAILGMMEPDVLLRYIAGDSKVPCTRITL